MNCSGKVNSLYEESLGKDHVVTCRDATAERRRRKVLPQRFQIAVYGTLDGGCGDGPLDPCQEVLIGTAERRGLASGASWQMVMVARGARKDVGRSS